MKIGLHCPNCGRRYECPCGCEGKTEWKSIDGDKEQCPCGFVATLDWWLDLELNIREVMEKVQENPKKEEE